MSVPHSVALATMHNQGKLERNELMYPVLGMSLC